MAVVRLALLSLWNRRLTALLAILAITLSVTLFLGVERVRIGAKSSFADTISGTDLIVGARAGDVQLLLYSVFRISNATRNITMQSLDDIRARPEVAWVIPLSLGDSHRGFRVLGTTPDYFEHYRYRNRQPLAFAAGKPFGDLFDAVVGADVAAQLGYRLDDPIVVQHGIGALPGQDHDDKPFRVVGVLAKTGTPVDRTVHVSLEAIEAIHTDWQGGARKPGPGLSADQVRKLRLRPTAVTAAMIGVKSKIDTFTLQRFVNEYREEPLTAILPGVALQELWSLVGVAETALSVVSAIVLLTALLGMVTRVDQHRVVHRELLVVGLCLGDERRDVDAGGFKVGPRLGFSGLELCLQVLGARTHGPDRRMGLLERLHVGDKGARPHQVVEIGLDVIGQPVKGIRCAVERRGEVFPAQPLGGAGDARKRYQDGDDRAQRECSRKHGSIPMPGPYRMHRGF